MDDRYSDNFSDDRERMHTARSRRKAKIEGYIWVYNFICSGDFDSSPLIVPPQSSRSRRPLSKIHLFLIIPKFSISKTILFCLDFPGESDAWNRNSLPPLSQRGQRPMQSTPRTGNRTRSVSPVYTGRPTGRPLPRGRTPAQKEKPRWVHTAQGRRQQGLSPRPPAQNRRPSPSRNAVAPMGDSSLNSRPGGTNTTLSSMPKTEFFHSLSFLLTGSRC